MSETDRQLLLAMHKGHEASARQLWNRHASRLLAYAGAILRDAQAREDAVQSVMVRVLNLRRAQLEAIHDVPAFLITLTRREAISQLRSWRRDVSRQERATRADQTCRDGAIDASVHATRLRRALDSLPRRCREVVVLKHVAGLTFDQIARVLEQSRNTAASRYRSAMDELRELLGTDDVADGSGAGAAMERTSSPRGRTHQQSPREIRHV